MDESDRPSQAIDAEAFVSRGVDQLAVRTHEREGRVFACAERGGKLYGVVRAEPVLVDERCALAR